MLFRVKELRLGSMIKDAPNLGQTFNTVNKW
jgi:hypothetical protein